MILLLPVVAPVPVEQPSPLQPHLVVLVVEVLPVLQELAQPRERPRTTRYLTTLRMLVPAHLARVTVRDMVAVVVEPVAQQPTTTAVTR